MLTQLNQFSNLIEIMPGTPEELAIGWMRVERYLINHTPKSLQQQAYLQTCDSMRHGCHLMMTKAKSGQLVLTHAGQYLNIEPLYDAIGHNGGATDLRYQLRAMKEYMHQSLKKRNIKDFKAAIKVLDDWEYFVVELDN